VDALTRMGTYAGAGADVPVIVRARAAYVYDENGSATWTGCRALYCVNVVATAAPSLDRPPPSQARSRAFYTNWSYAHPAVDRAGGADPDLAPGNLNRVFFTPARWRPWSPRGSSRRPTTPPAN